MREKRKTLTAWAADNEFRKQRDELVSRAAALERELNRVRQGFAAYRLIAEDPESANFIRVQLLAENDTLRREIAALERTVLSVNEASAILRKKNENLHRSNAALRGMLKKFKKGKTR